jgi:hypothetical protein
MAIFDLWSKKCRRFALATGSATQPAAIKDECNGQSSLFGSRAWATLACGFAFGVALT